MEKESANWCRFALLIINEGTEVLQHLFLLESLTSIFTHYSSCWIKKLDEIESKLETDTIRKDLHECLSNSAQSSEQVLINLLQLRTPRKYTHIKLMEDIDTLQQWKNNIKNELDKNVSDGVKTTLNSWLSQIQQELEKRNSTYTILRRWDSTFLDYLFIAQGHLQVEIENHEQFPNMCIHILKSLNHPSSPDFQYVLQNFKSKLETWKSNCVTVLQSFEDKCKSITQLWQNESEGSELLVQFLANIKVVFSTEGNAHSLIDRCYGKHYEELEGLFKTYEKKASKCESRSEISDLIGKLRIDLARVPSFKNIQFTDFINKIKNTSHPKLTKKLESKLDGILRTGDLKAADNSLLMNLVRKINLIHDKFQEWDEDPPDCDTSISADLLHLRSHRNKIVAHTAQGKIPSAIFDNLWKDAKEIICRIASRCGKDFETRISKAIDQRKECPLETGRDDRLRQKIVEWCRKDILTQLSARSSRYTDTLKSIQKAQANVIGRSKAQRVYVCSNCDVEFQQEHDFSNHKCIQAQRVYVCRNCDVEFQQEHDFANHKCIQAPKYYTCGKCQDVSSEGQFKNHKCSVDTAPGRVKCKDCRKKFSTAEDFQKHKCIQVPRGYECGKCNKQLSTEEELKNHRCPEDPLDYKCDKCKKDFSTKQDLENHRCPEDIRDHKCDKCKKRFSSKEELANHRCLEDPRDYKCDKCKTDFSTKQDLENHRCPEVNFLWKWLGHLLVERV